MNALLKDSIDHYLIQEDTWKAFIIMQNRFWD